jgi:release factor glutamine methyltransferase
VAGTTQGGSRTLAALLDATAAGLRAAGIAQPRLEARLLLAHVLGLPPAELAAHTVLPPDAALLEHLAARRAAREPLALILGHRGFWTLDLAVSAATLIPRADSETLIEAALSARPERGRVRRILDLGTGTGCLLLAGLSEFPAAFGVGVDRVPAAVALARRNAAAAGLAARAAFCCGDWTGALRGHFDLVLANPPYIPSSEIAGLMAEVARFEPASALDGGADGLAAYRAILADLSRVLAPDGRAVLEVGQGQSGAVAGLAEAAGLLVAEVRPDLGGVPRAVVLCPGR